jgi:hypothetical protein
MMCRKRYHKRAAASMFFRAASKSGGPTFEFSQEENCIHQHELGEHKRDEAATTRGCNNYAPMGFARKKHAGR